MDKRKSFGLPIGPIKRELILLKHLQLSTGGATIADVQLMRETKLVLIWSVKAAGWARSYEGLLPLWKQVRPYVSEQISWVSFKRRNWQMWLLSWLDGSWNQQTCLCPYSHFPIGAVLVARRKCLREWISENASYPSTNCGERTSHFKAVSEGQREFQNWLSMDRLKNQSHHVVLVSNGQFLTKI